MECKIQEIDTTAVYILRPPGLQELSMSRSGRLTKRGHISHIRLAIPTWLLQRNLVTTVEQLVASQGLKLLKNGNQPWRWLLVSTGHYPEHVEPQEEGQPRKGDHLRKEASILGCHLVAPYEPMEPEDEVLPMTCETSHLTSPSCEEGTL